MSGRAEGVEWERMARATVRADGATLAGALAPAAERADAPRVGAALTGGPATGAERPRRPSHARRSGPR
jgi:hypothetical protein